MLAIAELGADDDAAAAPDYLSTVAAPFASSEAVAGCLSCSLFAPASADAAEVERAVAALRFGCVAHNGWAVLGYMAACKGGSWGAHPAGGPRSGCGLGGNGYGHARVVKTVVRGPPLSGAPLFGGAVPPSLRTVTRPHGHTATPLPGSPMNFLGRSRAWLVRLLGARPRGEAWASGRSSRLACSSCYTV